jgi:hypothetical protein
MRVLQTSPWLLLNLLDTHVQKAQILTLNARADMLQTSPWLLLEADLILLDTAHLGDWEQQVYLHLCTHGYKGLLVLDDIHANIQMELFWAGISHRKYDLTSVGHAVSGTGLVDFGGTLRVLGL